MPIRYRADTLPRSYHARRRRQTPRARSLTGCRTGSVEHELLLLDTAGLGDRYVPRQDEAAVLLDRPELRAGSVDARQLHVVRKGIRFAGASKIVADDDLASE